MKKSELAQLSFRARIAVVALAALCALHGVSVILYWLQLDTLERLQQKEVVPHAGVLANDQLVRFAALAVFVGWIITGVLFLRWLHSAYARANDFGRTGRPLPTPGEAVTAFFIPFYNLVRPFDQMRNLLWSSDPSDVELLPKASEQEAVTYRKSARVILPRRASGKPRDAVNAWWVAYSAANLIGLVSSLSNRDHSRELDALIFSGYLTILYHGAIVVAGVPCLFVVQDVTGALVERARRLRLLDRRNRDEARRKQHGG